MIVVISESGEYNERQESLLGVFDSMEIAEREVARAIAEAPEKSKALFAWMDTGRNGERPPSFSADFVRFYEVAVNSMNDGGYQYVKEIDLPA